MQYMLLLADTADPTAEIEPHRADDGVFDDWVAYTRALHEAGVLVAGSALHGPDAATSVRVRAGERLLTDGPFVEAREHLLGYYLIDVPDLDAAIAWAAKVPVVRTGTVEVRPLVPGSTTVDTLRNPSAELAR